MINLMVVANILSNCVLQICYLKTMGVNHTKVKRIRFGKVNLFKLFGSIPLLHFDSSETIWILTYNQSTNQQVISP